MKKFNASDLSKKPAELFKAAREDVAIIQHKDRQGNVVEEFILCTEAQYTAINSKKCECHPNSDGCCHNW